MVSVFPEFDFQQSFLVFTKIRITEDLGLIPSDQIYGIRLLLVFHTGCVSHRATPCTVKREGPPPIFMD